MNRTNHATQGSQAVETGWLRLVDTSAFRRWSAELAQAWDESQPCVKVCDGTGCRALGSQKCSPGCGRPARKLTCLSRWRLSARAAPVSASAALC